MGRKCKLIDELQQQIVELIAAGNHYEVVCKAVGIGASTFYRWLERGREEVAEREAVAGQPPVWITTAEATELTGLRADKLRQAAQRGEIRGEKRGRLWFLDQAEVLTWTNPEGSEFFRFFEAVERAAAKAEVDLVELWKRQAPDNWRAVRDFLGRRYPERWGLRAQHQIEAVIQADVKADVEATVESEVTHKIDPEESREIIRLLKENLRAEAIKAGQEEIGPDTVLDALEALGGRASMTAIAEAAEFDVETTKRYLWPWLNQGRVRREMDGAIPVYVIVDAQDPGHGQDEEPMPAEPPIEPTTWVPPEPQGPPPRRGPIVACKTEFAKRRDGEL